MDVMFLEELADLKDRYPARLAVHHVLTREQRISPLMTGRIDPKKPEGNIGRPVLVDESARNVEITFRLDGRQGTVASPVHAQESILNAALRVRPDVTFACAGGVCGTCRAKLVSGTVQMSENYALEPDEIAKGFVLTCQSHPTSDAVTVDYDA